jgi:glucose-1-phosphate thymidylyltransferase
VAIQKNTQWNELIGLIPAGGLATRIGPLPCSKELYPIGLRDSRGQDGLRPKVVCHYLLEKMKRAGVAKAYIVLREGKWDIPAYFTNGAIVDMHISYLVLSLPFGTPFTLDEAYPFIRQSVIAFGFPDMLFRPDDVFVQLRSNLSSSSACVLLGLFPAKEPEKVDMVDIEQNGRVIRIIVKPAATNLSFTWGVALWTPVFTEFLHEYVNVRKLSAASEPETNVGNVIQAAIEAGLEVEAMPVSKEPYLDIGTPEGLARALRNNPDLDDV